MTTRRWSLVWALLVACCWATQVAAADKFPLKDGDTWVMGGDSITAQHLHSNYFEAFCYARYPQLTFRFRNSGVGGDTIPRLLARFDWDVAAWKPTVVSVELGMNDQGGFSVEQYIANMGQLHERIKASGARPVYLTASPINNGDMLSRLPPGDRGNAKLRQYALALQTFAAAHQASFADQFHAVIDVWGANKPREALANAIPGIKALSQDSKLAGAEHLRAFLAAQEQSGEQPVSMMGDPVHPGPPGQLMMAAALLKELGAEGFVSSVTIDATAKTHEAQGCQVDGLQATDAGVSFNRLDVTLPFPLPDETRGVLPMFPTILEMSRYTLKVTGLAAGKHALKINDQPVVTYTANELASGVNLTAAAQGPIASQGKAILAAVAAKESLVGQWRAQSRLAAAPDASGAVKERLAELTKQVEAADAKIREAAKPSNLKFELRKAG